MFLHILSDTKHQDRLMRAILCTKFFAESDFEIGLVKIHILESLRQIYQGSFKLLVSGGIVQAAYNTTNNNMQNIHIYPPCASFMATYATTRFVQLRTSSGGSEVLLSCCLRENGQRPYGLMFLYEVL